MRGKALAGCRTLAHVLSPSLPCTPLRNMACRPSALRHSLFITTPSIQLNSLNHASYATSPEAPSAGKSKQELIKEIAQDPDSILILEELKKKFQQIHDLNENNEIENQNENEEKAKEQKDQPEKTTT